MNVKVKICGIRNEMEIKIMNDLRPDYVGFIFIPNSRRFISPEYAGTLRRKLKSGIEAVGVFSDETLETVAMSVELAGLDLVQLNGHESGEYISVLREYITCPIIRAFKIHSAIEAERAGQSRADYVLLYGADGEKGEEAFDWTLASYARKKCFISGGLTPDNVQKALLLSHEPYAVDVSSGVEANRLKDYRKVMKFIINVREFKGNI